MFGYLNLNDPRDIGDNEAQEANNCRVDGGKLEFAQWVVDLNRNWNVRVSTGGMLQTYRVNKPSFEPGEIVRDIPGITGITGDQLGVEMPSLAAPFSYGAVASVGNPYPPGNYDYAITVIDTQWGDESAPSIILGNPIGVNQVMRFQNFPALTAAPYDTKTCSFNIYRRPLGGTEFLLVANVAGATASYTDTVSDSNLGSACETENDIRFCKIDVFAHLIFFKEKLFATHGYDGADYGSRLYFSHTGNPGMRQTDFYFDIEHPITDLIVKDESLHIFTTKKVFTLYGNDEEDFVIKDSGSVSGPPTSGAGSVAELMIFGERKEYTVDTTDEGLGDLPLTESLQYLAGNTSADISGKIRPLFPLWPTMTSGDSADEPRHCTGQVTNRFFVFRYAKLSKYVFDSFAEIIAGLQSYRYLIYDSQTQGFLTSDGGTAFQYRTKEFAGNPGRVGQFRTGFVVALGSLTVEIYGDGELLTTHSFTFATKTRQRFTVAPTRCNTFSFRFVGSSGTIVYEYGRLD